MRLPASRIRARVLLLRSSFVDQAVEPSFALGLQQWIHTQSSWFEIESSLGSQQIDINRTLLHLVTRVVRTSSRSCSAHRGPRAGSASLFLQLAHVAYRAFFVRSSSLDEHLALGPPVSGQLCKFCNLPVPIEEATAMGREGKFVVHKKCRNQANLIFFLDTLD